MNQIELYHFLYKELAKINTALEAYDKIFRNIEIKEKRYSKFFGLLIDIFTRYVCLSLAVFFDKRGDSWSLYKFDGMNQENIETVEKLAQPFIDLRHKEFAHLSNKVEHDSNFTYLVIRGRSCALDVVGSRRSTGRWKRVFYIYHILCSNFLYYCYVYDLFRSKLRHYCNNIWDNNVN